MTDAVQSFPHAVGPEKSVLSSILQDPQQYMPLAMEEHVTEEHFYHPAHQILFGFASEAFRAGHDIELVSLVQSLLDNGQLDRVGGPSAVYDIYGYAPNGSYFSRHVGMVREKYMARRVLNLCSEVTQQVFDEPETPAGAIQSIDRGLTAIQAVANGSAPILSLKDIVRDSFERFEARAKGSEDTQGIPTIPLLDQHLRGAHPGRLWILGAYPEGGKSVMASQMVLDAVLEGHPALFLSLEMSERDLMDRMIVQAARIDAKAYTEPLTYAREHGQDEISVGLVRAIQGAIPKMVRAPLRLQRPPNRNLSTILATVRRAHREMGIKIAVIDYVQLIRGGKSETKEGEVSEISHALQELAQDLQITLIVLSQLNADGDTKHGRVIEEDADAVIVIVQDRNKESETYKRHRHVLIAKDRHYGTGGTKVQLILDRERIRFVHGMDEAEKAKPKFNR
jgi:replicative DNA helicase